MRRTGWMVLVVGAALSAPVMGQAQKAEAVRGPATTEIDASILETRAQSMFPMPKKYGTAAKLYLQAADLRAVGDPQRVLDLVMASRLSYYHGRTARALEIMERAGEEALAAGDVISAANAFLDAGYLAKEAGARAEVVTLMERAQLLSQSPLLDRDAREAIRQRISHSGA